MKKRTAGGLAQLPAAGWVAIDLTDGWEKEGIRTYSPTQNAGMVAMLRAIRCFGVYN